MRNKYKNIDWEDLAKILDAKNRKQKSITVTVTDKIDDSWVLAFRDMVECAHDMGLILIIKRSKKYASNKNRK